MSTILSYKKDDLLKYYFYFFALFSFVIAIGPYFFGDFFMWTPRNFPTEMMISSIYVAMGITMFFAARNPLDHKLFVEFLILANIFHAIVMAIFAQNITHLLLDVPIVGIMGIIPLILYPWGLNNFLQVNNHQ